MGTRTQILALFGEPPPVRLGLKFRSETAFPGGRRLLLDYQVAEGERAPAYLLVPDPSQPGGDKAPLGAWPAAGGPGASVGEPGDRYPAVVAAHPHTGRYSLGKSGPAGLSANPLDHYGLDLCRRGYVVLCPDHLGFEDRRPPEFRRAEGAAPEGEAYERFLAMRLLLQGSSLKARYTFDLVRALDVLQGLEIVDGERLGVIGHGLGGQEAFWLTWFDARVRAGVSSCGLGTFDTMLRDEVACSLSAAPPGLLRIADMDSLVGELAPCPFMLAAAEEDRLYPIDGVRRIISAAHVAYTRAGVPDHFHAVLFPGGHAFPPAAREQSYRFLDRWLKDRPADAAPAPAAGSPVSSRATG